MAWSVVSAWSAVSPWWGLDHFWWQVCSRVTAGVLCVKMAAPPELPAGPRLPPFVAGPPSAVLGRETSRLLDGAGVASRFRHTALQLPGWAAASQAATTSPSQSVVSGQPHRHFLLRHTSFEFCEFSNAMNSNSSTVRKSYAQLPRCMRPLSLYQCCAHAHALWAYPLPTWRPHHVVLL